LIPEQFPQGGDRKSTSYDKSLKEVGITYDQSSRWQLEAKIPEQFPHGGDRKARSYDATLKEVGITRDQSSRWQQASSYQNNSQKEDHQKT